MGTILKNKEKGSNSIQQKNNEVFGRQGKNIDNNIVHMVKYQRNHKKVTVLSVILILVIILLCYVGELYYSLTKKFDFLQSEYIAAEQEVKILRENAAKESIVEYPLDSFNFLCVGNSITVHDECEYWWNKNSGMAASSEDKDYFHLVKSYLETKHEKVTAYAYNFTNWEVLKNDRAEIIASLDPYFSVNLNLVVVQLGENATDYQDLSADYKNLIQTIKDKAPFAQIILVGDFYDYSDGLNTYRNRDEAKIIACTEYDIPFVNLEPIKRREEFLCAKGTIIIDHDGNGHIVEHDGLAAHPNDEAMKFIADGIIYYLK